jgi:cell division initiation protein
MNDGIRVTPLDVQQKRFHVGFRGYDRTEVELFLDLVRDEMEGLVREAAELREFRQTYDQRVKELGEREEMIKNTMVMTQKLMEEQMVNAQKEAVLIVRDAELRGQQIVANAQEEKARLASDIQELQRRKHHFLQDVKKVIEMHREMINFEGAGSGVEEEPAAQ